MPSADDREPGPISTERLEQWRTLLIFSAVIAAIIIVGRLTPIDPVQRAFGSFGWVTERAVSLAKDLFEDYGELTVFLAPLLENTIFLGALIPGTLIMLLAGIAVQDGLVDIRIAIPLGILGAMIGDTISYGIGRFGWQRLGPEARLVRWSERMREPLLEHSIWLVLSYHFAGYSRLVGPAAAGFIRMPLFRWMVLDYVGVALWVCSFIMAGYLLGVAGLSLDDPSERQIQVFEIILFAMLAIGVFVILRRAGQRRGPQEETPEADASEPAPEPGGPRPAAVALDPADPPSQEEAEERVGR